MKKFIKLYVFLILIYFNTSCKKNTNSVDNNSKPAELGLKLASINDLQNTGSAPILMTGLLPQTFELNMPPAGNQGNQGSCSSWAVGYAVGSYFINKTNIFPYINNSVLGSPKFLYDQITLGNCGGTSYPDNLNIILKKGVCSLSEMPYDDSECFLQPNINQYNSALLHKIYKWDIVDKADLINIKNLVYSGYPVLISVKVDAAFDELSKINSFILKKSSGSFRGYHAITVTGWDDNKNAFKVLNSWGKGWGDNGYLWIDYNYFSNLVVECYVAYPNVISASSIDLVSCGVESSFGIKPDGTLWAWGRNTAGQLGDGTIINKSKSVQILSTTKWSQISCSKTFTTLAIKTDGTLWGWGDNQYGQLGIGSNINTLPQQIGNDFNWKIVSSGSSHSCGIKKDGSLWSWGGNAFGQLGDGFTVNNNTPKKIGTSNWLAISCGNYHTVAIKADGTLWTWGRNSNGELGNGTTIDSKIPIQIGVSNKWKHIFAGNGYSFAIEQNGILFGWGYNLNSGLGDGTTVSKLIPVQIGNDLWKQISLGDQNTAGIKVDGTLWAWGRNDYGQLGDGTLITKISPVQIGSTKYVWESIACGLTHTIARKTDGTIWAWGSNFDGELGDGTTKNSSYPIQIK